MTTVEAMRDVLSWGISWAQESFEDDNGELPADVIEKLSLAADAVDFIASLNKLGCDTQGVGK